MANFFYDGGGSYPSNGVFYPSQYLRPQNIVTGNGYNLVDPADVSQSRLGNISQAAGGLILQYTDVDGFVHDIAGGGSTGPAPASATYILQQTTASLPDSQSIQSLSGVTGSFVTITDPNLGVLSATSRIYEDASRHNTIVGSFSGGGAGMTGTDNTGLGVSAFQNSFGGGSYNVGVGNTVLLNVRSGEANNAFGVGALEDITTGSNNVAVGYQSQGNSTLSNDNVTVGYHAGQNLGSGSIVGSQNVIIGSNASNLDILTNGCVTIGYNAENGSSLSRVNTVSIGMNTYSDGNHHCTIVGSGAGCTGLNNCLGSIALGDGANVQNVNGSMAIGYNCSVTAIGACNLGGGPSGNGICLGVNNPAPACTLSLVPSTTTPCCVQFTAQALPPTPSFGCYLYFSSADSKMHFVTTDGTDHTITSVP